MSNDIVTKTEDFTPAEKEMLEAFKKNGLPGIVKVTENDIMRWHRLYSAGRSYDEIVAQTNARKDHLLYISDRAKWCQKRLTHYDDLVSNVMHKLTQSRLESINAITAMSVALSKYLGDKFNKYIATQDPEIIENIDPKFLMMFTKSTEMLEKLMQTPGKGGKSGGTNPVFNINLNTQNGQVSKSEGSENDIEITDENAGQILRVLSETKKNKNKDK